MARQPVQAPTQMGVQPGAGGQMPEMNPLQLLLLQAAAKKGNVGTMATILKPQLEGTKLTAEEKKQKMTKEQALRIITSMENQYFIQDEPLSYGRIEGAKETANAYRGTNPALMTFLNYRTSIRPTFARAAGDVGNLSLPEQKAAVALIPTGMTTPEEAVRNFATIRTRFNLPARDLKRFMGKPARKAEDREARGLPLPGISEEEFGTAAKAAGPIVGSMLPFPLNIAGGGGIAMAGEAIPKTMGRSQQALAGQAPGYGEQMGDVLGDLTQLKTGAKYGGLAGLLSPVKTLGGLRGMEAGRLSSLGTRVSGENILSRLLGDIGKATVPMRKPFQKYGLEAIEKYGGQKLPVGKALAETSKLEKAARTLSGRDLKTSAAAQFNKLIANALRAETRGVAPTTVPFTKAMSPIIRGQQFVSNLLKRLWPFAAGGFIGGKAVGAI